MTWRFFENDGTYRASALTFTSLLAIVPLMSVSFTILSAFPVFHSVQKPLQDFIFQNFVPATGEVVKNYLQSFTAQASQLSVWGLAFLFVTAILLMYTIERAMNQIWRVQVRRKGISAFLLYWAILSLTPLLMGLSLILSSYLMSAPLFLGTAMKIGVTKAVLINWLPFGLAIIAFTLLYVVVPNCKVSLRHGFFGALLAAILFELAKLGFTFYLSRYQTYQLLYGAFATVPIFFLWVYWVWVIVLIGGEVAHGLSAHYDRRFGPKLDGFTHAIRWLGHLWQAQREGRALALQQLIENDPYNYDIEPGQMISHLVLSRLARQTSNGKYILARDLSTLTCNDIYRILPWPLPTHQAVMQFSTVWEQHLAAWLKAVDSQTENLLGKPLEALFSE